MYQFFLISRNDNQNSLMRRTKWSLIIVNRESLHVMFAFWLTSFANRYSNFENEHRFKKHKTMSTSNEIIKAIENIDNENLIETFFQIVKKTLLFRFSTQSNNENHDVEKEFVQFFAIDSLLSRFFKSLISIFSSSDFDNEQATKILLKDDDDVVVVMKDFKYDVIDVHEKYVLNTISNRIELIVIVWSTSITLQLVCRWDLTISREKRLSFSLIEIRNTMNAISESSSQNCKSQFFSIN